MKEQPDYELFIEIARLLKKYNPELSKNLADHLSSSEFIERLVSVLHPVEENLSITASTQAIQSTAGNKRLRKSRTSVAKGTKKTHKKDNSSAAGNQRRKSSPPLSLIELEKTDPEKSALLIKFYNGLMDKTFLPTLGDIRTFASNTELPPIKADARSRAIPPLVKALLPLPVDKLKTKLDSVMPMIIQDDRSLEGWANIILDKEQRTK